MDYLLLAFAPTIQWLFVGRIIAGLTGASITTATAYIADVSTPENRAKNFGMIGAAFGLGFIIGPVIGGLLGQYGARVPFYAAAILCLLNFLYGYFILPESLAKENRRAFDIKRANPIGALLHLKKYPKLIGLVIAPILGNGHSADKIECPAKMECSADMKVCHPHAAGQTKIGKCDMTECAKMTKDECAKMCDDKGCTKKEKEMCLAHFGADGKFIGKSECKMDKKECCSEMCKK
jgi:hypothetical protein